MASRALYQLAAEDIAAGIWDSLTDGQKDQKGPALHEWLETLASGRTNKDQQAFFAKSVSRGNLS